MGMTWSQHGGPKKGDSEYAVSPMTQKIILEEKWETTLVLAKSHANLDLIDVDLFSDKHPNPLRHEYRCMTDSHIQSYCPIVILFPHHPDLKKRVLWTNDYKSLAPLNGELNDRVSTQRQHKNNNDTPDVVFCVDTRIIRVHHIQHTCYLVWLKHFNEISINEHTNATFRNVPCIVEMNGQRSYRNIVVLHKDEERLLLKSIDVRNTTVTEDTEQDIFVREDDPRKYEAQTHKPIIKTSTNATEFTTRSGLEGEMQNNEDERDPAFDNHGHSDEDIHVLATGLLLDTEKTENKIVI